MPLYFINLLRDVVGASHVISGEDAAPYCSDWRGRYSGVAIAVVLPNSAEQVSAVVALCVGSGIGVVPQGGNTGLSGGAVPLPKGPQVVINLSRMSKVHVLDAVNHTLTVGAGCTLKVAQEAAERVGLLFPLGLSAIAAQCEIGGNISTNAGGIGVLRYGNMRDLVLGLEVVLPDGRIWNGLRSLRKDNTGYDLKHLFIGAEGTLGVITAAVLKLFPRPQSVATAFVAVKDPATAVALLAHLRAHCGNTISAFEIISSSCLDLLLQHIPDAIEPFPMRHDWMVLIELSDVLKTPLEEPLLAALKTFGVGIREFIVTAQKKCAASWWILRKNISEAQKCEGISVKHDISVPISGVAEFIAKTDAALHNQFEGVRIVAFGHIGDGNIHYNVSMPDATKNMALIARSSDINRIVYDIVHTLNGSISAEHGLGQLKRNEIGHYKSALELELMSNIKHALDPGGYMNPGKVL